jgi:hypothetical protein
MRAGHSILLLLSLPTVYFVASYLYLACWHGRLWLFDTVVHENGRLTLLGSLLYYDHFLACLPMILFFALCVAGGFALGARGVSSTVPRRAILLARNALLPLPVFIVLTLLASVRVFGWDETRAFLFQYYERDGILSPGGSWNQLQVSNLPIALGSISLAFAWACSWSGPKAGVSRPLVWRGLATLGFALVLFLTLTLCWWPGWSSFLNPRWLAHSIREIATYPLTGIPIALAAVTAAHLWITRQGGRLPSLPLTLPVFSMVLFGLAVAVVAGQLLLLQDTNIHVIAQKPAFAPNGLSIPYLLAAHVFEHWLDFALIGPLSAGIYALLLWSMPAAPSQLARI